MQALIRQLALQTTVFANETGRININPQKGIPGAANLPKITVGSIISGSVAIILIVAALVFFFMLVAGGIRWMTAGGDKEKAAGAKEQLTSALIGLTIVFVAWAIINLIKLLFGINILGGMQIPSLYK